MRLGKTLQDLHINQAAFEAGQVGLRDCRMENNRKNAVRSSMVSINPDGSTFPHAIQTDGPLALPFFPLLAENTPVSSSQRRRRIRFPPFEPLLETASGATDSLAFVLA